ncbi:DUF881 domain-containing protein [Aeromicrobium sp.]|uniref:DUF881 domain-containing protein n=1 Tax=Aeromicrobium sp. TaxID=1871063 RepID=UPI0019CC4AE0|nr:DUF881 domain-containing protein [Aeromicrobium sp.]MBC7632951.1 DUF881 domain-containing protein [Aeromicrobium sp.]
MPKTRTHARQRWPVAVLGIFALTGFLFVAASVSSGGADLRPAGGDAASLLQERSRRIDDRRKDARELRSDIDALSSSGSGSALDAVLERVKSLEKPTGLTSVEGPGMRVTLTDAPRSVDAPGIDPNLLVVHQQDIQAFVNALWAGGAEAMTLQGQRLISTTGIKCVGNTVVLDGVPYSPPYIIEAIGDTTAMDTSLQTSPETITYANYSRDPRYQVGLKVETLDLVKAKAYAGSVGLTYARATG